MRITRLKITTTGSIRKLKRTTKERFWSFVDRRSPEECWPWIGGRYPTGHGVLRVLGRTVKAHRISYEIHNSEIPAGLFVLHRCNNGWCVNPQHLYVGTQVDNMRDREAAGHHGLHLHPERAARGERNGACKLTDAQIQQLRNIIACGTSQKAAAVMFGISRGYVSRVVNKLRRTA